MSFWWLTMVHTGTQARGTWGKAGAAWVADETLICFKGVTCFRSIGRVPLFIHPSVEPGSA